LLGSTLGDIKLEGNTLRSKDGCTLLLGNGLRVLVGSNDNVGPQLGPNDGSVLTVTVGTLLGLDEGTILILGVKLGEAAGSIDTDGPTLGPIEEYMLFDGTSLQLVKVKLRVIC
jgi:hypothetical protein